MAKEEKETKVKRPTAKKRDIQNEKRRLRNRAFKASVRTAIRKYETSLSSKDKTSIQDALSCVYSHMDKGVKNGVFKLNKANRTKARLAARLASAAA